MGGLAWTIQVLRSNLDLRKNGGRCRPPAYCLCKSAPLEEGETSPCLQKADIFFCFQGKHFLLILPFRTRVCGVWTVAIYALHRAGTLVWEVLTVGTTSTCCPFFGTTPKNTQTFDTESSSSDCKDRSYNSSSLLLCCQVALCHRITRLYIQIICLVPFSSPSRCSRMCLASTTP